ncbi:MAG: hypothetical protein KAS32_27255, partial [Candidatus Peribacteraceae bacterium]|nr:hypothetical protein [Candidatus Peribacteraceae bacterium]
MADKQTDLQIVIEAINKATATLKQVEKDLSSLSKTVGKQDEAAQSAAMGFSTLVAGVATGTIAAQFAISAFRTLTSVLTDLPKAFFDIAHYASEVEGMGIAMHVVANNAGIMAEDVDKVRDSVVEQNVTTEAANRLMTDLIRNQLEYTQATELATAAQNIAVASGASTSETIERISQSISSGRTWLLRRLGLVEHLDAVYERYAETLGKTSEELDESQRKQAVVNYVLQEGEKYAGAYEQAMKNAAKVMRSTTDRVKEISYAFGSIFEPALYEVAKAVYDFVDSIVDWAHENEAKLRAIAGSVSNFMRGVVNSVRQFIAGIPWDTVLNVIVAVGKQLAYFAQGLKIVSNTVQMFARSIMAGIRSLKLFGEAIWALQRGDFRALRGIYAEWTELSRQTTEAIGKDLQDIGDAFKSTYRTQEFDLREWWDNIQEIEGTGWEDRLKQAEKGGEKLSAAQRKKLEKMLRDIERANRDYQKAVDKRVRDFERSFDDLVISHRDAISDLTDDLAEESRDYYDKLKDLVEDYDEAMDEMVASHKKKTESILEDMEDERKKAEELIEELMEDYNEETSLIEKEAESRLANLRAQLDKEKALGDKANKVKIDALEQMIAFEEEAAEETLEDKEDKLNEEIDDITEALDKKLAKLQKELDEESTLYEIAFAKLKTQYEEDLADAKEYYEEKREKLQEELDKELKIREKYAEDFKRIGDRLAEDDITRLVRKHEETLAEMERDHQDRLSDIKENAFSEGLGFTEGFVEGFDAGYPEVQSRFNQMGQDIDRVIWKLDTLDAKSQGIGDFYTPANYPGEYPWYAQKGGVFSRPVIAGEAGAEVVLPLNFPKRMAMIMKSMGLGQAGGGQVTQNFYV